MNPRFKNLLFLLLTVYIIPGIFMLLVDRKMLPYYLLIVSSSILPYYLWPPNKKRSCKIFGIEFKF
jgi:hypothetical protein